MKSRSLTRQKRAIKTGFIPSLLFLLVLLPFFAHAASPVKRPLSGHNEKSVINNNSTVTISGRIDIGILNGESHEYVYQRGNRISKLNWDLSNNAMLNIGLSARFNQWINVNSDVWFALSESSSMDDYDWQIPEYDWTHWSHHDDTQLSSAVLFDINAEISIYQPPQFTLFGIVGFRRDTWAWDAYGGTYVYSINGFRDTRGTFGNDLNIISYEQEFNVPYAGIGLTAGFDNLSFTARIIGSPFVDARAEDNHYLRNLRFEDDYSSETMIGFDLLCRYRFNAHLSFTTTFKYQDYKEMKGETTTIDTRTGRAYTVPGSSAGLSHSSALVTLGILYHF
ncbi:MAG: hypothetical protein CSA26_08795 [Desulfobacterales bacterium]|nr:MAG: hypothetical protein CSA26_08795 [Desulfobacterales bacterium]